jgi:sugar lactone lactonase YvrE
METMMRIRFSPRKALLVTALLLAAGCTEKLIKEEQPVPFPPPPSEPRFLYQRSIRGVVDFQRVSFFDKLFGVSVTDDLSKPFDVYASGDKVYISDTGNRQVLVVDLKAEKVQPLGEFGADALQAPTGVRGAPDGTLYVADGTRKLVQVYDAAGKVIRKIGTGKLTNPAGIALNIELERLYVADPKTHTVKVFSTRGEFLFTIGAEGGGGDDGQFVFPSFVAIDRRNGNVYVSDTNNFRIQVFDKDGAFLRKFGELGDAPGYFQRPKGIALDSEGHCYVVENVFNNFQIFNDEGKVLTWVGFGGRRGPGVFYGPSGLYIDEQDRIYVVDALNKRIQVFQYLSAAWKQQNPALYEQLLSRSKAQ